MSKAYYRQKRKKQQMLQMQAMTNPNMFFFKGDSHNLQLINNQLINNQLINNQLIPNTNSITDAYIVVTGVQTKPPNTLITVLTIIFGVIFIFPLIFTYCDWWKSLTYPAYQVPLTIYQKLQIIIKNSSIQSLHLQVLDNGFGKQKSQILCKYLSTSQIKAFTFRNDATDNDYKQKEYTNFIENMKPIKMLPFPSKIIWWTSVVN